jgi:hypothetical protein
MKTPWKDLIATVLVAAVAVAYIGYLVRGDMPFIEDPRGMAGTGLVLGIAAFLVMRLGDATDRLGKAEIAVAVMSFALGVVAVALAETGAAEVLLAVFMGSIAVMWLMELADHVGVLHHQQAHVA